MISCWEFSKKKFFFLKSHKGPPLPQFKILLKKIFFFNFANLIINKLNLYKF